MCETKLQNICEIVSLARWFQLLTTLAFNWKYTMALQCVFTCMFTKSVCLCGRNSSAKSSSHAVFSHSSDGFTKGKTSKSLKPKSSEHQTNGCNKMCKCMHHINSTTNNITVPSAVSFSSAAPVLANKILSDAPLFMAALSIFLHYYLNFFPFLMYCMRLVYMWVIWRQKAWKAQKSRIFALN